MLALLAAAQMTSATLDFRAFPRLAQRSGQDPCWASYVLAPDQRVCVPKELWFAWLDRQELPNGRLAGTWKVSSSPVNQPQTLLEPARAPKVILRTFQASRELSHGPETYVSKILVPLMAWLELRRERLSTNLRDTDLLGVCRHLALSEKMREDPGGLLRQLGFVHLLTATGIHLLALAALWNPLLFHLGAGRRIRSLLIGTSVLYAWLLSGCRPGMLLPIGILLIRELAKLQGWRLASGTPFALVLCAALILSPGPSPSGFVFYGVAVAGGSLGLSIPWLPGSLALALGSWAATSLLELHSQGALSLITPALSLLTIPWLSFFTLPGLLIASLPGFDRLAPWISKITLQTLLPLIQASLKLPAIWLVPPWTVGIGATFALAILVFRRRQVLLITLSVLMLLAVARAYSNLYNSAPAPRGTPQALDVEQLDIGQGDAALVTAEDGRAGLIDSGSEHALPEQAWLQVFASRGIRRLSWIALTHLDEDHSGGALMLARLLPIECVETSEAELATERGRRYAEKLALLGVSVRAWGSGCVPFPTCGPPARPPPVSGGRKKANSNMSALVVPLTGGGFYLSLGDADQGDELGFLGWLKARGELRGTGPRLLKISHHGSETSTAPELLRALDPDLAWISSGVGNRFDHPRASVLERLARLGIRVERTDRLGSLDAKSSLREAAFHHRPQTHRP